MQPSYRGGAGDRGGTEAGWMRVPGYAAGVGSKERFWASRLRWRMRGAPLWPAFAVFTLLDAVVLNRLPPVTTIDLSLIQGLLIATFSNLFLVGALAPFMARRLQTRRRAALAAAGGALPAEIEREVLSDRLGVALLAAGVVACLASGLANRPVIVSETEATEEAAREVRGFVAHSGDDELERNLETANTKRLGEGFFRVCIARDDRRRHFCLFVDTDKEPTQVDRDPSAEPNSEVGGR